MKHAIPATLTAVPADQPVVMVHVADQKIVRHANQIVVCVRPNVAIASVPAQKHNKIAPGTADTPQEAVAMMHAC
jgi:hypothetical protein